MDENFITLNLPVRPACKEWNCVFFTCSSEIDGREVVNSVNNTIIISEEQKFKECMHVAIVSQALESYIEALTELCEDLTFLTIYPESLKSLYSSHSFKSV